MKNERLFAIVNHLLVHGRTAAPELARRFEVSQRTIYRDVDALSAAGVPVVAFAGAGGGVEIAEGFRIEASFLSREELGEITGLLEGFSEALKDARLASSLGKLAGLGARPPRRRGPPPDGATSTGGPGCTDSPAPPLVVSLTPWGGASPDGSLIEVLRGAIAARRPLLLGYRDGRGEASERVVEPYSLVLGGATWYLHAWCRLRSAFRLFRLSRVLHVEPQAGSFDPWLRAPVPHPFAGETDEELVDVVVRAPGERAPGLAEAFGAGAVTPEREGTVVVRFRCPPGDWLERAVLALGAGVTVLEPAELRDRVHELAMAVAVANLPTVPRT